MAATIDCHCFLLFYYTITSAEVHECKKTDEAIVVGIEIAIVVGLMAGVPQTVDEITTFHMCGSQ